MYLSEEGAKNISWPWLFLLQGLVSLAMAFAAKLVYMDHHFILLWLNPFDLRVDREGWWFGHSCVIVVGLLVSRGCFLALATSAPRMG